MPFPSPLFSRCNFSPIFQLSKIYRPNSGRKFTFFWLIWPSRLDYFKWPTAKCHLFYKTVRLEFTLEGEGAECEIHQIAEQRRRTFMLQSGRQSDNFVISIHLYDAIPRPYILKRLQPVSTAHQRATKVCVYFYEKKVVTVERLTE